MPELPEVEMCRRHLARWGAGGVVAAVDVRDEAVVRRTLSSNPADAVVEDLHGLVGCTAGMPIRLGKRIAWAFGEQALLIHLGMTGRWTHGEEPRHARLMLALGAERLWFADTRRFGCVVLTTAERMEEQLADGLGPDGLGAFTLRLAGRRAVKVALLDQTVLAGLGNIHAAEVLWRAGVHPARGCDTLTAAEVEAIASAIPLQLHGAVAAEEGTEIVYINEGGPNPFAVYGKENQPCPKCGRSIEKIHQSGRSTYLCEGCQA